MTAVIAPLRQRLQRLTDQLSPRQRQWAMLLLLLAAGVGMLWVVFASGEATRPASGPRRTAGEPPAVTHIGVMSPGQQVKTVDQWVGTAGTRLAQYESERESQARLNTERQAFEARTLQRFAELEQRLLGGPGSAASQPRPASPDVTPAAAPARPAPLPQAAVPSASPVPQFPSQMPPAAALPVSPLAARDLPGGTSPALRMPPGTPQQTPRWTGVPGMGPGLPPDAMAAVPLPLLNRVRLASPGGEASNGSTSTQGQGANAAASATRNISTFLPVSFTRGTLLGGLDAPTGGQAQSNPHPVLIRLADNAVLPNRFRGDYRECFVIAAGYGDISSERAYLRTENLSCVRADGAVLEVRLQGSVYGEDGKVGMRGRLVTKQGQMLANALLAGVVSGIGQGLASSSTQVSSSPLGTITSATGADAFRAGIGNGVGRALDRLAQYYIKLAENTFPVIEVDAGREIDVVITRGVRIDMPMTAEGPPPGAAATPAPGRARAMTPDLGGNDEQD